jgi:hypothetical protein
MQIRETFPQRKRMVRCLIQSLKEEADLSVGYASLQPKHIVRASFLLIVTYLSVVTPGFRSPSLVYVTWIFRVVLLLTWQTPSLVYVTWIFRVVLLLTWQTPSLVYVTWISRVVLLLTWRCLCLSDSTLHRIPSPPHMFFKRHLMVTSLSWDDLIVQIYSQFEMCGMFLCTAYLEFNINCFCCLFS